MNWYKKAKEESVKKPYKLVVIRQGLEQTPKQLENVRKDAYSSEQARMLFLKDYPFLKDYYQMNCEVEVRLDKEEFKRRQNIARMQEETKKKQVDEAWWNK